MKKWLASIDWVPILGTTLVLVLILWALGPAPEQESYVATEYNPFEYVVSLLSPEGWTAFFTFALFVSTGLLWWTTQQTLAHAEKASERELRAYVGIGNIYLTSPHLGALDWDTPMPAPPGHIYRDVIQIKLMNTGKTPATNVAVFVNWLPVEFGLLIPIGASLQSFITDDAVGRASRSILDAGMTSTKTISITTSLDPFRAAEARTLSLYFYGFIEYTDIFDVARRRHFRCHWEPWRDPEDRITDAREGNFEEQIS